MGDLRRLRRQGVELGEEVPGAALGELPEEVQGGALEEGLEGGLEVVPGVVQGVVEGVEDSSLLTVPLSCVKADSHRISRIIQLSTYPINCPAAASNQTP